ncbi:nucleolar protein 16 [Anopheles ziemanni]|uniref:nucleolar protein 16 n=1 Tax=Anopheles ziemanni TaxID=345580 RepID=UPI00265EA875|nr:nucleolar protein 16 [Anopheles ziemanni]
MVKRLRKNRRSFDYKCNRKRKGQKARQIGIVRNPEIRQAYNPKLVPAANIEDMGLAYDVNKAVPIRTMKQQMKEMAFELQAKAKTIGEDVPEPAPKRRSKQYVAEALERDAKEFRGTSYRLAKPQVRQITAMIDKHGFNYLAMERDRTNTNQETWRQFRRKIWKFLKITEQSTPYLERKGWLDCDMNDQTDPRWKEYCTDDEL